MGWPTANDQRLTTVFKERLQQFGAAACKNSAADFYFVIQLLVIQQLHYRIHCARFGIVRAIDEALDPGVHQRSGAHWARFNCSKQVALGEAVVTDGCTGLTQRDDFGVGGGIVVADIAVPAASDNSSVAYDHRSYRDFAGFEGALRGAQGFFHPEFVGGRRWSLAVGRWQ
jgi:hypothetical protein